LSDHPLSNISGDGREFDVAVGGAASRTALSPGGLLGGGLSDHPLSDFGRQAQRRILGFALGGLHALGDFPYVTT
jgi:hypothetical protein